MAKKQPVEYQCVACGVVIVAKSDRLRDRPAGYYFAVRRVTDAGNHYVTEGEVFAHDKPCAEDFVRYNMSANFVEG